MSYRITLSRRTILLAVTAGVMTVAVANAQSSAQNTNGPRIGLDGYCPVCVIDAGKWEKGQAHIQSTYDGQTYYFPNDAIKQKFDASPAKYVPALGGDCTVCYAKLGKRVPGSIRHAAIHNRRLFLFPSDAEKQAFVKNAAEFENTDLAANGECIVCLAKVNKHVPGSTKFTEVHNGFRYLFPSPREAAEFRRSPAQYAATIKGKVMQTSSNKVDNRTKAVTVAGQSACAGCEFGVTPISNPDELGLAIKTGNGKVIVVENAHKLYPEAYKARFDGQTLQVKGNIIKTDGNIAWLTPSDLRVVN